MYLFLTYLIKYWPCSKRRLAELNEKLKKQQAEEKRLDDLFKARLSVYEKSWKNYDSSTNLVEDKKKEYWINTIVPSINGNVEVAKKYLELLADEERIEDNIKTRKEEAKRRKRVTEEVYNIIEKLRKEIETADEEGNEDITFKVSECQNCKKQVPEEFEDSWCGPNCTCGACGGYTMSCGDSLSEIDLEDDLRCQYNDGKIKEISKEEMEDLLEDIEMHWENTKYVEDMFDDDGYGDDYFLSEIQKELKNMLLTEEDKQVSATDV